MNRTLIVEPEAEGEIAEAADWYYQTGQAVRTGFLAAVNKALASSKKIPSNIKPSIAKRVERCWMDIRTRFSIQSPGVK